MSFKSVLAKFWDSRWVTTPSGDSGYEAAKSNPNRSTINLTVQDARKDIDRFTRKEIIKKGRYLHRNSPIIRGIIERLVTFTVGTGLHPSFTSSDPAWNEKALKSWKGWTRNCDIESRMPFEAIQSIIFRAILLDGDIFALKTFGDSGRPRIQLVESQDIAHKQIHDPDGIELDIFGRPVTYVWKGESRIPADSVTHFLLPERAGQKRGISILASVINTAHDIDDILALEKAAVKDGSSRTDIIKTATGELPSDDYIGESVQAASEELGIEELTRYYHQVFSPEAKVLRHGDEHTPYVSGRPSPAWQGFMEFLCEQICFGPGLPPSLLLGTKVGGADTRREMATAQRVIDVWQMILSSKLQEILEYVVTEDITSGFLRGAPSDWRNVEWQFPAKLTVDAGREAEADREDVKMGLLTRREYFARWGQDWREQTRQAAMEAKEINDLAKEFDVERGEISLLDPNELSANAQADAASAKPAKPSTVSASKPRNEKGQFAKV